MIEFTIVVALVRLFTVSVLGDVVPFFAIYVCPAVIIICYTSRIVQGLLSLRIFKIVGKYSYDLYLWHCPIFVGINLLNYLGNWDLNFYDSRIYIIIVFATIFLTIILKKLLKTVTESIELIFNITNGGNGHG